MSPAGHRFDEEWAIRACLSLLPANLASTVSDTGDLTVRVSMTDWALFTRKTVAVFGLSLLVVPLVELQGGLPAMAYVMGLIALHLFVLAIYCYRVRFRELDPDARSLVARVGALAFMVYLLVVVSDFEESTPTSTLLLQMLVISVLHTVVLALLMTRIRYRGPHPAIATLADEAAESQA